MGKYKEEFGKEVEMVEFQGRAIYETDLAFLFLEEGMEDEDMAVWIPVSKTEFMGGSYRHGAAPPFVLKKEKPDVEFEIPEWLAIEKGLI